MYVDGGSRFRLDGGWASAATPHEHVGEGTHHPAVSIGDGDSSAGSLDELLPAVKDYSDLAFVLRSLPPSVRDITMLGFLGGRRDHELANLGEVAEFLKTRNAFARVDMVGGNGDVIVAFARGTLGFDVSGEFSIFVLEPAGVEIRGMCKYPLSAYQTLAPLSSHGLSNVGNGRVDITSVLPCFVVLTLAATL